MKKCIKIMLGWSVVLILYSCSSTKELTPSNEIIEVRSEPLVSYASDLRPLMLRSCTPCHFPERGKVEMLNTLETTKSNIDEILLRVQLSSDHEDFMPFRQKRQALTTEEIDLFKAWAKSGMSN